MMKQAKKKMKNGKMKRNENDMSNYSGLVRNKGKVASYSKTIDDLPEDLLAKILKGLPVKYILRCICIQKSWYRLIHSSMFISLHGNHIKSNTHNHPKYLFFESVYTDLYTVRVDDKQCDEYAKFELLPPSTDWFANSNGLICTTSMFLSDDDSNIYLWNPLVGKYKTLPDSPLLPPSTSSSEYLWQALAFGFVPQDDDYVVVRMVKRLHSHLLPIDVYSLKTNSWKTIIKEDTFNCSSIEEDSVFVNGAAFWLAFDSKMNDTVMCFDTLTNILREISLPPKWYKIVKNDIQLTLHPFGQSIAFLADDDDFFIFHMWVLKDDMVNEFSWEKKMSFEYGTPDIDLRDLGVTGLRNNGEPILFDWFDLFSYNPISQETVTLANSWYCWDNFSFYNEKYSSPFVITPFVESLVLLDNDEAIATSRNTLTSSPSG